LTNNDDGEDGPSADEQHAFSEAHRLIHHLIAVDGLSAVDVGAGVLIAALSILRKHVSETEVAKILYEYADHYATRHLEE
jgi:hypothetical protein